MLRLLEDRAPPPPSRVAADELSRRSFDQGRVPRHQRPTTLPSRASRPRDYCFMARQHAAPRLTAAGLGSRWVPRSLHVPCRRAVTGGRRSSSPLLCERGRSVPRCAYIKFEISTVSTCTSILASVTAPKHNETDSSPDGSSVGRVFGGQRNGRRQRLDDCASATRASRPPTVAASLRRELVLSSGRRSASATWHATMGTDRRSSRLGVRRGTTRPSTQLPESDIEMCGF